MPLPFEYIVYQTSVAGGAVPLNSANSNLIGADEDQTPRDRVYSVIQEATDQLDIKYVNWTSPGYITKHTP